MCGQPYEAVRLESSSQASFSKCRASDVPAMVSASWSPSALQGAERSMRHSCAERHEVGLDIFVSPLLRRAKTTNRFPTGRWRRCSAFPVIPPSSLLRRRRRRHPPFRRLRRWRLIHLSPTHSRRRPAAAAQRGPPPQRPNRAGCSGWFFFPNSNKRVRTLPKQGF